MLILAKTQRKGVAKMRAMTGLNPTSTDSNSRTHSMIMHTSSEPHTNMTKEDKMQANRTRNKPVQVYFTKSEIKHIRVKMERALTKNMSAYVRKMAIDGLILNMNFDSLDRLFSDVGKASRLINKIVKRVNSDGRYYAEDIAEIQKKQLEILQAVKTISDKIV